MVIVHIDNCCDVYRLTDGDFCIWFDIAINRLFADPHEWVRTEDAVLVIKQDKEGEFELELGVPVKA